MVYVLALVTFLALSSACWVVSVACYRGTVAGSDPAASSRYRTTAAAAVTGAAVTSFVPFPAGYVLGLLVWGLAAFAGLGLGTRRAAVLFFYLALGSYVTRLVVLGVMEMLKG